MLKIEEDIIYLTRGDDAVLDVNMQNLEGVPYVMQSGDTLTLTVRERPEESSLPVFAATSTPGSSRIIIPAKATAEAEPGQYSADIQLTTQDDKRYTVWPDLDVERRHKTSNMKNFVIMPEVTMS